MAAARRRALRRLESDPGGAHVAMVQKQADFLPSLRLERAAAAGRRLVYDVDDAIWHDTRDAGGHPLAALKRTRRKVRWLAGAADHVIAANRVLAEHLSDLSDRVTVIPSLVDPAAIPPRRHRQGRSAVLGWIGSPPNARFLDRLAGPLARLGRELPGRLRLLVVGGTAPTIAGVECEHRPWSVEAERRALGTIDVGLMPLPDTLWTRGKSAYKALLCMAAGIPVVADDVGITAEAIADAGFAVRGDDEWVDALRVLIEDPSLRVRLGEAGRRRVEADYSVARWAPQLARIIRGEA